MAAQAALPPDLTKDDIQYILEYLNMYLNKTILEMLMHGVTLWSIFTSSTQSMSIGRCIMVLIIFSLYVFATVAISDNWAFTHHWTSWLSKSNGDAKSFGD
ncbi:hypothetical protein EDD18DRAFT_1100790 [Armillaria luteobubalina]|uniref:Uncharacterized protein n=1 Tax=Armillaria luteobubalina TaxID=153913 RepID=A0AA39UTC3_9AGAR|nr:hypothetical protein EDD18DRAFT_1100790 [Armillaria luteobubalina]